MGTSTDGILFYGFCWTETVELFPEEEGEWVDFLLKKRGEKNPWDDRDYEEVCRLPWEERERNLDLWCKEHEKELDEWRGKKKGVEEEFGVDLGYHCSGDYGMPYLYIVESRIVASRGNPERVKPLWTGVLWNDRLERWLEALGVEKPQESPYWWLVSYWG